VKINVALSELPDFTAMPGTNQQDHHTGSVELCFSPQYAERAFQDAHIERKAAVRPFVDGTIPTTLDKKLAPQGVQVFSMFTQWVPHQWSTEPHHDERAESHERLFRAPEHRIQLAVRFVVGAEQNNFLALNLPRHEVQQLERGRVRPLEIFEHDEQGLPGGEPPEKLRKIPE